VVELFLQGRVLALLVEVGLLACPSAVLGQAGPKGRGSVRDDPSDAASLRPPPMAFEGYSVTDSVRYNTRRLGTLYHFTKVGAPAVDVFIFPYPVRQSTGSFDVATAVAKVQADDFQVSLPSLRSRGLIDDYRFAFNAQDSTRVVGHWWPGRIVAVATKRRSKVYMSLLYAYGLHDEMLTARTDLPARSWRSSLVPAWIHHLVGHMAVP